MRWIDLSAHGMRLYVAVLPNARALVIDKVDPSQQTAVKGLGFRQRPTGAWVKAGSMDVNPREYLRLFPKAVVREMKEDEYLLRLDSPVDGTPAPAAADDIPEAVSLGFNRLGQKVFEEEGRRHIVDSKGRRIREDAVGAAMPGMFLHAVDDGSLAMCAEGFVETANLAPGEAFSKVSSFVKAIGLSPEDQARFKDEVAAAAVRYVTRKGGASLRDKFGKALEIRKGLRDSGVDGAALLDKAVLGRRLIGMDRDLIGKSVNGGAVETLLSGLLPKAVRTAEASDADVSLAFAASVDEMAGFLSVRPEGSMTVCFVAVPDSRSAEAALAAAARHGTVEAAAFHSPEDLPPFLALTFNAGPSSPVPEMARTADAGELWSWASLVATERSRAIDAIKSGLSTEADLNVAESGIGKNSHQVPYASASQAGKPRTMVPRELEAPTRQALDRIISNFGDVDDRVAVECGFPKDSLGDHLSPEQVDAVALAIHAEERDRAFLVADNTGVGKGRALMSLAKRAVLQGRKVLVLTEKDSNLSDLQRDVAHIGALDVIRPAVMNRDVALIDERTGEPFETAAREPLLEAIRAGTWPEGVQCVYATYSQFNKGKDESERSAWLHSAVDGDVLVVADEVHNAASGDSNTSENIAAAIAAAGSVVLSSATFAGNAKMMAFFERVFPAGLSGDEIAAMMRKGGEQFQEVVSAMLVADGVMIRREKDLSDLQISQHLDAGRLRRNREYMDALASVIAEMALLSGDLDNVVEEHNGNQGNLLKGLQMKRLGFGSPLYSMTRLFTASLLAEFVAERAIEALRNGEKPIILVENTIQGVLEDALAEGGDAPDFRAVVHRILDQMTKITVVDRDGGALRLDAQEEGRGVADAVRHIRAMIDALPPLPASAIDEVKRLIGEAGYSCGEITGRSLEVENGKVVPRRSRDRTRTKNDFNAGRLDATVINSSGSTGIDLHASARFKDQRPRVMIELQGQSHIQKQIQAYGRISRYDDVVPARIELPSSGLPSEARLAAMRNQKLRRLSANVTSNRDSAYLVKNIPDLINAVGDAVITRYAEMRPDLMKRLCLSDKMAEGLDGDAVPDDGADMVESARDNNRSANEFLSRLSLLPTEHQEKVLAELTAEYELHVAELEARGENPLRPKEIEGIVHIRNSSLFEGSLAAGAVTAFDGPMHMLDVSIERVAEPVRADTVMREVEEGAAAYGKVKKAVASLVRNRDKYLEPFLPKNARTVDEAIAMGSKRILRMAANMRDVAVALDSLAPGREIEFDHGDGEKEKAVVICVTAPSPGYEHLPHLYKVDFAVPGATSIRTFKLDTLLSMPGVASRDAEGNLSVRTDEGLEGSDYDAVLDRFETAVGRRHTFGRILTTNIFRAVRLATQHGLGSLVSFVDQDGKRHRGVLVKKGFDRKVDALSMRIDGAQAAFSVLTDLGAEISSSPTGSKSGVVISRIGESHWSLKLPVPPKRRGEVRWPSEGYKSLFERGAEQEGARVRVACEGEDSLREALEVLAESGYSAFYVGAKYRSKLAVACDGGLPEPRGMA